MLLNSRSTPTILRNESATGKHWLQLQVRGRQANRDSVGARVKLVAGNLVLVDEIPSGRGYQSHYGSCLHDLAVDQRLLVLEGAGAIPLQNLGAHGRRR